MENRMWIATENFAGWVPCPSVDMPAGTQKWITSGQFLNGGAYARRSISGARAYEMSWPYKPRVVLDSVEQFFSGAMGGGPFYIVEPSSMRYNVMPPYLSHPGMAADGAPSLIYDVTPTKNIVGGAFNTATYVLDGGESANTFTFAIPAGYKMLFTWSGTLPLLYTLGGGPETALPGGAQTFQGGQSGALFTLTVDTTTAGSYSLLFCLGFLVPSSSTDTVTSILAEIRNQSPGLSGSSVPLGKGTAGLDMTSDFEVTEHSAALDRFSGSVSLVEVGPWL